MHEEWSSKMQTSNDTTKKQSKAAKRFLIIGLIVTALIMTFIINGILLSESWGLYRSKQWFKDNRDSLIHVNDSLLNYLSEETDGIIPSTYPDYLKIEFNDEATSMAMPYEPKSLWVSTDAAIVAYSYESSGFLLTTSANYGVYYSEDDEPFTVVEPFELSGNEYITERLEENWFFWWVMY